MLQYMELVKHAQFDLHYFCRLADKYLLLWFSMIHLLYFHILKKRGTRVTFYELSALQMKGWIHLNICLNKYHVNIT